MPAALSSSRHRSARLTLYLSCLAALGTLLPSPGVASDAGPIITTVAGSVREGPARSIGQNPLDVVVHDGAVYMTDFTWNVVRRLDLETGQMTTVAGNGGMASSSDGEPATKAQIRLPMGVAFDPQGNMYVTDSTKIRRVDFETGKISSVAGKGTALPLGSGPGFGPRGLDFDDEGNLYVAERLDKRVYKIDPSFSTATVVAGTGENGTSGDGGPATQAKISGPTDVAVDDSGRIYIAASTNDRVRMVDTNGIISTVVGNGRGYSGDGGPGTQAQIWAPRGLALADDGTLYISDGNNARIRRLDPDGTIHTIAGVPLVFPIPIGDGGPATQAYVSPEGMDVDTEGNLYFADTRVAGIRVIRPDGTIDTLSGNGMYGFTGDGGPATNAQLYWPEGSVSFDPAGNMLIPDTILSSVRKVDTSGIIETVGGTGVRGYDGDNKPAREAKLYHPLDAVGDAAGNIYISENFGHRIRRIDPSGTVTTIAGTGIAGFSGDLGPATAAQLKSPYGLALSSTGDLYVADSGNHRIRKIDLDTGVISTVAGIGVAAPAIDGIPALVAPLNTPQGISLDAAGNLYIADMGNHTVRKIGTDGFIRTIAGTGASGNTGDGGLAKAALLSTPWDVAAGPDGTVYIADWGNNRVRAVGTDGIIRAFAGSGTMGFLGDGGPATAAHIHRPTGVAVGPDGAVYIVDQFNSRIRRVA